MALRPRVLSPSECTIDLPLIVGFTGPAKSGKDTSAKAISSIIKSLCNVNITMLSFASPIREIGKLFGYTEEQMSNQELKETYLDNYITNVTPRKFMQLVGTDMFRNCLDKNIWVRLLESKIVEKIYPGQVEYLNNGSRWKPNKIYFITDVRFPNEAEAIKKHNGIVIRVNREQGISSAKDAWRKHESEIVMDEITPDYVWNNDSKSALGWCSKSLELFDGIMMEKNITLV